MCAALFIFTAARSVAQSDELALKSRRGKELMSAGRFKEAASIYSELVRALPNNPGLLLNLGMAEQMGGQPRKAIPRFEAALKLDPDLLPAWLSLGASRLELGEPALAVAPLEKAIKLQPQNEQAIRMLADALLSLERFEQAALEFGKLSQLDPKDPRAWSGLGNSYESLAGRAFETIAREGPESAYWLALVADSRVKEGQFRSAFFFYRQALEKAPDLHGIHAALAEIYRQTNHADWAAKEEEKERQLPPPAKGRTKLEERYWQARHYNDLALQAFSRLAELPPSLQLHELLADIHRNHHQYLEAVKDWRAALKLAPGNPQIERGLATSLYLAQDYKAAAPALEKLLKREPRAPDLHFFVGDTLLQLDQVENAIRYLEKALTYDPKLLPAHASLGLALARAGKRDQAIPHLKAALKLDQDGSLHYQLSRAYQSTGQLELAKTTLAEYEQIEAQKRDLEKEIQISAP